MVTHQLMPRLHSFQRFFGFGWNEVEVSTHLSRSAHIIRLVLDGLIARKEKRRQVDQFFHP
ncbi:hypothetical protein MTR_4g023010 [Medicago truncatula]|uniref:Uncharacterized protein n=1 Tax=Medicago truncatula TaxID=3880 RepID=G7I6K5_MEDTR|nr:hypothetical protein MTR_4g023010 [Medicago truncatula]